MPYPRVCRECHEQFFGYDDTPVCGDCTKLPTPVKEEQMKYASVSWTMGDLQTLFDVDDDTATKWWEKNSNAVRARLIEYGWDVIHAIGTRSKLPVVDERESVGNDRDQT